MTRAARFAVLSALYFSQGLPFGFFTLALPVVLRAQGVDLKTIGASSLLLLPWGLKFLWGPIVDRTGSRKRWIVPLQLATVAVLLGLATIEPTRSVQALVVGMLLASLLASTQDVATDGLAVALLRPEERGLGNGLQVGAYRFGMIVGGSAVLVIYGRAGPPAAFAAMAFLLALATAPILLMREPSRAPDAVTVTLRSVLAAVRQPGIGPWLLLLSVYKAGEAATGPMLKTLLVDAGWALEDLAWTSGLLGSAAGLCGALFGGWATGRIGRRPALVGFGVVQAAGIALCVVPAVTGQGAGACLVVEHVTSGMATAALFTKMMDKCRPGLEATDYTLQASVVVLATGVAGSLSGTLADAVGYGPHFALCALLALIGAGVAARVVER
jgi:MFS transporter, PAT family, beta-lactamase induction signal transducer AmpG